MATTAEPQPTTASTGGPTKAKGWGTDAPDQLGRSEDAVAVDEARCEVGDLDAVPVRIEQARPQDRGAVLVGLLHFREALQLDQHAAVPRQAVGRIEQREEHRVAVEARHAAPDHRAATVDEGADRAVADERKVERCGSAGLAPCRVGRDACHGLPRRADGRCERSFGGQFEHPDEYTMTPATRLRCGPLRPGASQGCPPKFRSRWPAAARALRAWLHARR